MDVDLWSSLPPEILLEIFRRLETTAVLSSTGVCKPWRRAIIGNAVSCLRPRPDCFAPRFLLSFFQQYWSQGRHVRLHGMLESAAAAANTTYTAVSSLLQPQAGIDLAVYDKMLSSRDGLLLLGGSEVQDLCLCSTATRQQRIIPAAPFQACTYVLVTGYDLNLPDGGEHNLNALILAVKDRDIQDGMTYQIFSTLDGAWGVVKRSSGFEKGLVVRMYPGTEVICHGSQVHWLTMVTKIVRFVRYTVAIDALTGRTWLTELPGECRLMEYHSNLYTSPMRLATSRNGRLSVVNSAGVYLIEVWVLISGDRWMMSRKIDLQNLPRRYTYGSYVWFDAFCPRSGWLLGYVDGQELLTDAERGSFICIGSQSLNGRCIYPHEMDWSTYLSKMKLF